MSSRIWWPSRRANTSTVTAPDIDKGRGGYADCRRKYVREEVLNDTFGTLLDQLHFDEEVLDWVKTALKASHADERCGHEQAIHRCQTEYKRLEDRLQAMYLDKLDGRIDNVFYDRMSAQWRTEQAARSSAMVRRKNPTWMTAFACWSWHTTLVACS